MFNIPIRPLLRTPTRGDNGVVMRGVLMSYFEHAFQTQSRKSREKSEKQDMRYSRRLPPVVLVHHWGLERRNRFN